MSHQSSLTSIHALLNKCNIEAKMNFKSFIIYGSNRSALITMLLLILGVLLFSPSIYAIITYQKFDQLTIIPLTIGLILTLLGVLRNDWNPVKNQRSI